MEHSELEDMQCLIELAEREHLAEIEVQFGEFAARIRSESASSPTQRSQPQVPAATEAGAAIPEGCVPVLSPVAGVFYRSPSPAAASFVEVGDHVGEGEVVGLIDAMKLFNNVEAPVTGTVRAVVAEDGSEVAPDEPLMYIEPATNNLT